MIHYKGKTSFDELIEMPNRMFNQLYINLLKKLSTPEGQEQIANEQAIEKIEEVMA